MQAHKQAQQVSNSQTLLQVLRGVAKQAEKYALNYLYKKYYKRIQQNHLHLHIPLQQPIQQEFMQFPEGGSLNICKNSCEKYDVSGGSPSETSQHMNNHNGDKSLEEQLWEEWYGKYDDLRSSRSNEEEKKSEETNEERTEVNNCEDMVGSICCCLCFKSLIL